MNRDSLIDERKGDSTGADAQLKDRPASGEFGQEVDCGFEDVGSEHVWQRLVISRGNPFAEVIVGHDRTVPLYAARWPELVWPNRFGKEPRKTRWPPSLCLNTGRGSGYVVRPPEGATENSTEEHSHLDTTDGSQDRGCRFRLAGRSGFYSRPPP